MQARGHMTDLRYAWNMQIKDLPRNPRYVFGGTLRASRDYLAPQLAPIRPKYMQPIVQKRNTDDLEKIRQMLTGLLKRPPGMTPNAAAKI